VEITLRKGTDIGKLASWFWASTSTRKPSTTPPLSPQSLPLQPVSPASSTPFTTPKPRLIMSQPTPSPNLTPQFCFNTRLLRDFLRLSRASIDDSISTNLNALLTPSTTTPFDPSSTSIRNPHSNLPSSLSRQPIPRDTSTRFIEGVLFPSWNTRSDVISYCTSVATSPDPDDPDLIEREASNRKDAERIVNERLDPYSGRFFPQESRAEMLASVLRNENAVEGIVRTRTWGIVSERCEGFADGGERWEEGLERWRQGRR
jgi:hypothetical protein